MFDDRPTIAYLGGLSRRDVVPMVGISTDTMRLESFTRAEE